MRVKVGVIGTGAIGIEHIDRINQKTQGAYVTAVSDINVKAAKEVAKRRCGCRCCDFLGPDP